MTLILKKKSTHLLPQCIMHQKRASPSPHVLTDQISFVKSIPSIGKEAFKETPIDINQRNVMSIDPTTSRKMIPPSIEIHSY